MKEPFADLGIQSAVDRLDGIRGESSIVAELFGVIDCLVLGEKEHSY